MDPYKYQDLINATDEELIAHYDSTTEKGKTAVWLQYFLDELVRRRNEKQTAEMLTITKRMEKATTIMMWTAIMSVIVSIVTLYVTINLT